MKERPLSLATNHHTLRVGPPDAQGTIRDPSEPTPAALVRAIECSFKKQLLKRGQMEEGLEISATGLRPIRIVTKRFGHTAFVAGVLRGPDNLVESLTVCRAGLDNEEDDAAIVAAGELIRQDGTQEFVESLIELVREQPRPLAVHVHLDEDNLNDPSVRIVTHCLAECFFDQFGLEKSLQATDL
jgi:hypothetical protein